MENKCNLCPRNCNVDRINQLGYCGAKTLRVAKIMKHFWEEPIISGEEGSGTIFFSHCSLKCKYCQNWEISHNGKGEDITVNQLVQKIKELEKMGVNNINFVTPTHYTNEIIEALKLYRPKVPVVWNTSGYENVETIKKLKGYVDIFLTDFKYSDNKVASELSGAADYVERTAAATKEMRKIVSKDIIENGIMKKGIIVRHLILPTYHQNSKGVIAWIKDNLGTDTYISLMSQYMPCYKAIEHPKINRRITKLEYDSIVSYARNLGFTNGYIQDFTSASGDYVPCF